MGLFFTLFRDNRLVDSALNREEEALHEPSPAVLPPAWDAPAATVTVDSALGLVPVYRAVQILATSVSQLTIDTWRGVQATKQPGWLARPDIKLSRSAWLAMTTTSLATRGNAYWRVIRDSPVDPINALLVLDPTQCTPGEDDTLLYRDRTLRPWEYQHLQLLRVPGRSTGLGPIQAAQASLRGALDTQDYASEWFSRSGRPAGTLNSDQPLTAEQAAQYKERWDASPAGETRVLGSGLTYTPLSLTPEEAQWVSAREMTVQDVARLFGIPSHLMLAAVSGSNLTYQNIQDAGIDMIRYTLAAYLREIEECLSNLLPRNTIARFNLEGFLRPNTTQRYAAHAQAISSGFLTVDEVRAIEGMPPFDIKAGVGDENGSLHE